MVQAPVASISPIGETLGMEREEAPGAAQTEGGSIIADAPRPVRTPVASAPVEFLAACGVSLWLLAWVFASAVHASHSGTLSAAWWIRMGGFWVGWLVVGSVVWSSLVRAQKIPAWASVIDAERRRASAWLFRRWWRHRQAVHAAHGQTADPDC